MHEIRFYEIKDDKLTYVLKRQNNHAIPLALADGLVVI